MATVVNIRHERSVLDEPDVVRIDRATKFGQSSTVIGRDGSREEVIEKYRARLWRDIRAGRVRLEDLAALNTKPACLLVSSEALSRTRPGRGRPLGQPPTGVVTLPACRHLIQSHIPLTAQFLFQAHPWRDRAVVLRIEPSCARLDPSGLPSLARGGLAPGLAPRTPGNKVPRARREARASHHRQGPP